MGGQERQKKGFKRKRGPDEAGNDEPPRPNNPTIGQQTSFIGNKQVRSQKYNDLRREKKKAKKKERKQRDKEAAKAAELGQEPPKKQVPRTIENTREADETTVRDDDEEVAADVANDEFAPHFARGAAKPHVLLTTSRKPTAVMFRFLQDLLTVLPCTYYKRGAYHIKEICEYAKNLGFSDVMVVNEDRKTINGLLLIHLPDGPTAHFRVSNVVLSKKIKGHGRATTHRPELILNNFTTRLGHRVGRMFASVFPTDPQFRGRRAVTFHNQRDFIFFRHHRYVFEEKETKKDKSVIARLQELGPRFTLKLMSLQKGTFDTKSGEYEWVHKPEMDTSRRKFFL